QIISFRGVCCVTFFLTIDLYSCTLHFLNLRNALLRKKHQPGRFWSFVEILLPLSPVAGEN
ncbi:unnamed protein product, partial [Linum tenue]